ncbi:P-loop containing nucleoside triphosphate hydrolase protein [Chytridium lagenaria]|nr:P-loop containing nucleoside triphosphate hydrolase protein [Chytridium lagenaria]
MDDKPLIDAPGTPSSNKSDSKKVVPEDASLPVISSGLQSSSKDTEAVTNHHFNASPRVSHSPRWFGKKTAPATEEDGEPKPKDESDDYKLSFPQLFRFADANDRLLMLIGTGCALANGVSQPVMTFNHLLQCQYRLFVNVLCGHLPLAELRINLSEPHSGGKECDNRKERLRRQCVFGNLINSLLIYGLCNKDDLLAGKTFCVYPDSNSKLNTDVRQSVIYLVAMGLTVATAAYLQMSLWMLAGERQTKRIREEYFKSVLRQDVSWFDKTQTGDITTRLTADILTIQEGISDKVGATFQAVAAFLAGFVIAFVKGWKLALVLCSVFPLLAGVATLMGRAIKSRTGQGTDSYAQAGAIAQEALSAIRTIVAFGGEKREIARYKIKLEEGEKSGRKIVLVNAASIGAVMCVIFSTYSLGFYYGGTLIGTGPGDLSGGDVLNVFFSIIIGAFSLGQAGPNLAAIGSALGAARKIFSTLDRQSPIDAFSEEGDKLEKVEGAVEFTSLDFHYPQRTDVPILKNFNLNVKPGQTVALVGASGSGKSTIVKLLERFYDPVAGSVLIDGKDIRTLNVAWLRDQIGFVGQEPVLFDLTVRQNLLFGLPTSFVNNLSAEKLEEMVKNALVMANAWGFVQNLPEGLDTPVGEAGSMMSGGQKQRLAIARAIMRQPKILLLDEATSALDTESERIVQSALDKAAKNRTTIVIAHRLSTIKNADLIVVMDRGEIVQDLRHHKEAQSHGLDVPRTDSSELLASADDLALAKAVEAQRSKAHAIIVQDEQVVVAQKGDLEMQAVETKSIHSAKDALSMDRPRRRKSTAGNEKEEEEARKKKEEAELLKKSLPWGRLWKINSPEWAFLVGGVLSSGGNGILFPMFANIFAEILNVFANPIVDERNKGIRFWALMFVLLAIGAFFSNFTSIATFGFAGESLTKRLRLLVFTSLMRQDIGFFDEDKHSTGALTARLAEDANQIQGLTGRLMGTIVQTMLVLLLLLGGLGVTLVVLAAVPFIGIAGAMQIKAMTGFGSKTKEAYNAASEIANEAIDQIRTVATLGKEKRFLEAYQRDITAPHAFAIRGAFVSAIGFAISQGFIFFAYALAFYAGSQFVIIGRMTPANVFKVMFAVIFTAVSAGQASGFAPNYVQAKLAALSVFALLDRESKIDATKEDGETTGKGRRGRWMSWRLSLARPDVPVLNGLNVAALPGQTVALVGASGCGKSTVIAILERWYDLLDGSALLSDQDVREWRIKNLREQMALVGQEPVLFNLSVRENIVYGSTLGTASQERSRRRRRRRIFMISSRYNTIVGSKGGQLSGGQKQRVAIARALIRNPSLLLLDEATSALDSESERVVQEALDAASKGRTTIVIAHRLSTIQNADMIVVIDKGVVVEMGNIRSL